MDEQIKQELKTKLGDYLQTYHGISHLKNNFNCLNPNHNDQNPSMSLKDDYINCFACGKSYDLFSLIGQAYNLSDYKDQVNKACQLYGYKPQFDTGKGYKHTDRQTPKKINKAVKTQSRRV